MARGEASIKKEGYTWKKGLITSLFKGGRS